MRGLSPVAASGGHSSSRCAGLSLSRPLLLRSTGSRRAGSVVVAHGPSCSAACGIFPDQGSNPCPVHQQADSQTLRHQGSPITAFCRRFYFCFGFEEFVSKKTRLVTQIDNFNLTSIENHSKERNRNEKGKKSKSMYITKLGRHLHPDSDSAGKSRKQQSGVPVGKGPRQCVHSASETSSCSLGESRL